MSTLCVISAPAARDNETYFGPRVAVSRAGRSARARPSRRRARAPPRPRPPRRRDGSPAARAGAALDAAARQARARRGWNVGDDDARSRTRPRSRRRRSRVGPKGCRRRGGGERRRRRPGSRRARLPTPRGGEAVQRRRRLARRGAWIWRSEDAPPPPLAADPSTLEPSPKVRSATSRRTSPDAMRECLERHCEETLAAGSATSPARWSPVRVAISAPRAKLRRDRKRSTEGSRSWSGPRRRHEGRGALDQRELVTPSAKTEGGRRVVKAADVGAAMDDAFLAGTGTTWPTPGTGFGFGHFGFGFVVLRTTCGWLSTRGRLSRSAVLDVRAQLVSDA